MNINTLPHGDIRIIILLDYNYDLPAFRSSNICLIPFGTGVYSKIIRLVHKFSRSPPRDPNDIPPSILHIFFWPQNKKETEELNKSIVNKWLTEVNKENFEMLFDELWTEDCKQYFNSSTEAVEYDDFKQMIHNLYTEYPIIHHEVHDIIACGDKVVAKFSAKVHHDSIMFGVPATGKEIEWSAIAIFQLSNGKIQTRWELTDLLGMYEQLGMKLELIEMNDN